jgi:hypothetical protein
LLAPVREVVDAHRQELDALGGAVPEDRHEPVRSVVGQALQHRRVDDAEHGRREADAKGERDNGQRAQAGTFDQHPRAVPDVAE